jgi:uncharacterized protein with GYD domain
LLGGSVVDGRLTFGDYDVLVICQLPDNVSATALSMAISAGGAVKSVKTTPLVTFDEGLEALKKAKGRWIHAAAQRSPVLWRVSRRVMPR